MGKKIWLMHSRNFGNQSTGMATQMQNGVIWRVIAWPPGLSREKIQKQSQVRFKTL